MRKNSIPALLITLALALPVWARAHQSGRPAGAGVRHAAPAALRPQPAERLQSPSRGQAGVARPAPQPVPQSAARSAPQPVRPQSPPRQIFRGQGPHNGDWLRNTMQLPPQERQQKLEQDQHFRQLPPQRQQQLRNRLQTFNSLPPQQQQRVLNRMEMIEHLRPEQQQRAQALFGQFRAMEPQRKEMVRRTLREMRTMPPEARERMLNSPQMQSRYSPQEIQMLRGFNDIGFVGAEQ